MKYFATLFLLPTVAFGQLRDDGLKLEYHLPWVIPAVSPIIDTIPLYNSDGELLDPYEGKMIKEMQEDPSGWKYNIFEWELLRDGIPVVPEYYYDEDLKKDNGGVITT